MTTDDARRAALLDYVQAERRVCPNPMPWTRLWEMLPQRKRAGMGWEPPLPLILAAWHTTGDWMKRERLREHIEWAAAHGALDAVDDFLRGLPPTDWRREQE